jgi:hypothetical protein
MAAYSLFFNSPKAKAHSIQLVIQPVLSTNFDFCKT